VNNIHALMGREKTPVATPGLFLYRLLREREGCLRFYWQWQYSFRKV